MEKNIKLSEAIASIIKDSTGELILFTVEKEVERRIFSKKGYKPATTTHINIKIRD